MNSEKAMDMFCVFARFFGKHRTHTVIICISFSAEISSLSSFRDRVNIAITRSLLTRDKEEKQKSEITRAIEINKSKKQKKASAKTIIEMFLTNNFE